MAEDNLKNLVVGSILGMLFIFAIFSFFFTVSSGYNKDTSSLNNYYNFSAINQSLSNTQSETENLRQIASEGSGGGVISFVSGFFDGVGSFFGIAFNMIGFILSLFDLVLVGTLDIIVANPIITGTLIAITILIILFGIFRFLKQGS